MWTVIESPIGELRLVEDHGAIVAVDFHPFGYADARLVGERDDSVPVLVECARQLGEYFAGTRTRFELPLAPVGTPFQQKVWGELVEIGYGETSTYGGIAARLGLTGHGARAVGLANGRNPIPVVIPCHRVIGANGTLTGYAGGIERKQLLLDLERDDADALF
ncbi:methylated-DNA--[protein]-cysteine S-methyltransferase [Nocardioides nematodiphilus]|uniref:methylated-DNA--[protein]-cysteine S-methyltransferase n=1 Tax=Nocardioides nematodiphilus TaxID=2849669 RepID=UPI001CD9F2DD|nr:methylated-DNA--[protein]-cysteine S-methyltransferase [Nocardioides nematodiphilus]MCA1984439.1 methylated-DNA--[protein]-cysteine S-methyltransferase [Nocardioides nematodiphilus]